MASKIVRISNVSVQTQVPDNQRFRTGTPDCFVMFSSAQASVGSRNDRVRNSFTPAFDRDYSLVFGGPEDTEQLRVELWDHDRGSGSGDDLMESAVINLSGEPADGTRQFALSAGGSITFTWRISGRPVADQGNNPETKLGRILTIRSISASRLLPRDGRRGVVDPYCLLEGRSNGEQMRLPTQTNQANPQWQVGRTIPFDAAGFEIAVWDEDTNSGDDLCGSARFTIDAAGGDNEVTVPLFLGWRGRELDAGEVRLEYSLPSSTELAPTVDPGSLDLPGTVEGGTVRADGGGSGVRVRREIRRMGREEQERFARAVRRMMEGAGQTSEYFRLAGYHGWPQDFCHHAQETFPGWHRGYLVDFELALAEADRALGGDGRLGLPYWDWSEEEVNGELFPQILREYFGEMPPGLVDAGQAGPLGERGYGELAGEEQLRANLRSARVAFQAEQSLAVAEHWLHASTRFNRRGYSVESPHNSVHVACGFPMTSVRYAAFHPIFFLHHCNVDRVYQRHVVMEGPAECAAEFRQRQRQLALQGERDRFRAPLEPFRHPLTGAPLMPADTFDTRGLGYEYDALPPEPRQMLREEPVFAAFLKVPVLETANRSYMMHVFVFKAGEPWAMPTGAPESWMSLETYGGCAAMFGGKGGDCSNCLDRQPYNVLVEVQEALRGQKLGRREAQVKAVCVDDEGQVMAVEDTPVPAPVLVGAFAAEEDGELVSVGSEWASSAPDPVVRELQALLQRLGHAPGAADGKFGPKTEAAVLRYQLWAGLAAFGKVDSATRKSLRQQRNDLLPDAEVIGKGQRFTLGQRVRYSVSGLPGYLDADRALAEMAEAFEQWGAAMGVKFEWTGSRLKADIRVEFDDLSLLGEEVGGGLARSGGQLAEASAERIRLDAAERWLLQGEEAPARHPHAVALYAVLLHEIGHSVGLPHSQRRDDVMFPFYSKDSPAPKLSYYDKKEAKARVKQPTPPAPAGGEPPQPAQPQSTQAPTPPMAGGGAAANAGAAGGGGPSQSGGASAPAEAQQASGTKCCNLQ